MRTPFLVLCVLSPLALAQGSEEAFVQWASKRAIPVASLDFNSPSKDLQPVRKIVGKARVVALGEPVHGAHEPLAFRNRMIRYLVTEMGFRAVATETGFAEAALVDSYINGAAVPLETAAPAVFSWNPKAMGENRELIEWLRQYNADPAHTRKVHFYGIDVTGGEMGQFRHPGRAIDLAIRYLTRADAEAGRQFDVRWQPFAARFSEQRSKEYADAEKAAFEQLRADLREAFRARKEALRKAGSDREYAHALRALDSLETSIPLIFGAPGQSPDLAQIAKLVGTRERLMGENLRWALEQEPPGTRVAVFAHNQHVMNAPFDALPFKEPPGMAGTHFRAAFGRDLVVFAVCASKGAALSQPDSLPESIDGALRKVRSSPFLLDLRPAAPPAAEWLRRKRPIGSNNKVSVAPVPAYDALFYIESLTLSQPR